MKIWMSLGIFGLGAVAGTFAGWTVAKSRYQREKEEEIASAREAFRAMLEERKKDVRTLAQNKPALKEYAKTVVKAGYAKHFDPPAQKPEEETVPMEEAMKNHGETPYIITPEEFGSQYDYDPVSLTYYADGVLTDDNNEEVDDISDIVPVDFADHFGEYEDDSVYVRNDRLCHDYEILRDERTYASIRTRKPHEVD